MRNSVPSRRQVLTLLKPPSMVTIGNGRDDPCQWVKAAYLLIDAMESDPDGKPPAR
jgi:hypothetical protein